MKIRSRPVISLILISLPSLRVVLKVAKGWVDFFAAGVVVAGVAEFSVIVRIGCVCAFV